MGVLIHLHRVVPIDAPQCTGSCSGGRHACDCDTGRDADVVRYPAAPIELDGPHTTNRIPRERVSVLARLFNLFR